MRAVFLMASIALVGGCSHPRDCYAKSFVEWDARSDAENVMAARCHGPFKLIKGRAGFLAEYYECVPQPNRLSSRD